MSAPIIAALIGLAGTALGSFGGYLVTLKLVVYRLDVLEKKVDVHNNLIARMYEAEKQIELHEEKLKVANHRITDLEGSLP